MSFIVIWKVISSFFTSLVSGIVSFVRNNPFLATLVLTAALSAGASYYYTLKFTTNRLDKQYGEILSQERAKTKSLNEKIEAVEKASKDAADEAAGKIKTAKTTIDSISTEYEKKLKDAVAQQKIKTVMIEIPGATTPMTPILLENGEVVCRRLPSTYADTVNKIIDAANASLK